MAENPTNRQRAERIAETVLYEGYILYPYRVSSAKNRSRWTFGSLFPETYGGEPSRLQVQCLLRGSAETQVETRVRFLHIVQRREWQEAMEREAGPGAFCFDDGAEGKRAWKKVQGVVETRKDKVAADAWRVTVSVANRTPLAPRTAREEALKNALASTHVLLEARGGEFVSLIDPPPDLRTQAAACRNEGAWPVLVGSETASDTMLASPIILYDDPQIAPESPGLLYDATEIDEILSLRVLALTDDEKREAAALDPRARALIERTESLTPAQWKNLHGCFRDHTSLKPGDRVRIRPKDRGDIMDIALAGKVAVVQAVERDFDERLHVAVALEDDPGRDLGLARMPGHRFFFSPEEVERVR